MKPDQDLCQCAADVLTAAALPELSGVQILPRHSTEERKRPCLLALTEDMQNQGAAIRKGSFILRYLADGDDESAETSQERLNAAETWLTGEGRLVLKTAMQERGNWLRKLTPGDSPVDQDGDRGRQYDQRFTTWIQTAMP